MTKRRSKSKSTTTRLGWKEFLVTLLLILIVWAAQEFMGVDLLETGPAVQTEPAGDLMVMFTVPRYPDDGSHRGGLDEQLAAAIDAADHSVDLAAFELELERVAEALIRAEKRGVVVRVVTDSDYAEEVGTVRAENAGVPVVFDERGAYMHNKFVVIDGLQVWTGSWNLTDNGTYRNDNNVVIINSERIADNYTVEFEEMFAGGFGPTSEANTPYPQVEVGDTLIETYFSPEDEVASHVIPILQDAESSIYFMAFSFTDDDISRQLLDKHRAGLTVQGVMEGRNAGGMGSDFDALHKAGVDVLKDGNPYVMHHKVIIVDEAIVITGSYNFTANAAESNDENLLIIHNPAIAAVYMQEFERVYQLAEEGQ